MKFLKSFTERFEINVDNTNLLHLGDKVKKILIPIAEWFGLKNVKYVGSGSFGMAYTGFDGTNQRVVKITTDIDEARAAHYLSRRVRQNKNIINYFDVREVHNQYGKMYSIYGDPIYAIYMEKVTTLEELFDDVNEDTYIYFDALEKFLEHYIYNRDPRAPNLAEEYYNGLTDEEKESINIDFIRDFKNQVDNIHREMKLNGFSDIDLNVNNVGFTKDFTLKFFDTRSKYKNSYETLNINKKPITIDVITLQSYIEEYNKLEGDSSDRIKKVLSIDGLDYLASYYKYELEEWVRKVHNQELD